MEHFIDLSRVYSGEACSESTSRSGLQFREGRASIGDDLGLVERLRLRPPITSRLSPND